MMNKYVVNISVFMLCVVFIGRSVYAQEDYTSEVVIVSDARVSVRVHPRTGEEYVSIHPVEQELPRYDFQTHGEKYSRPDYEMLSHTTKSGDVYYDGPVSDRTKVYVLAATLAASGIAAGAVAQAGVAAAATTASTASAGAGAYATAGAVLMGISIGTPLIRAQPDPHRDDFIHESRVKVLDVQ
ncbi:hypothetical protein ACFL3D_02195 [Candidatus Omnitrophota bacterium]